MRPDPDYIKKLLDAFEASEKPFPSISDLQEQDSTIELDDVLAFHLVQMSDRGLLRDANGSSNVGVSVGAGGGLAISVFPLRLTPAGHDFAQQIRNPEVYEKVKSTTREGGLAVAIQVAGAVAAQYALTKLGLAG